jgi:hypothetical protein
MLPWARNRCGKDFLVRVYKGLFHENREGVAADKQSGRFC